MMLKQFRFAGLAVVFVLAVMLAACGGGNDNEASSNSSNGESSDGENTEESSGPELGQKNLTEPYVAWARETISTHILADLLERVGYNVNVKQVEAGPMWSSVADGSADFHTSAWLPATHESYWKKYKNDIVKVKQVLDKAPLALGVPSYVDDINTMEDLKKNKEFGKAVDHTIVGIDPGAGIMQNTEEAMKAYGLDKWELKPSSESAMLTKLQNAIKDEEPIVVPLWKPHWIFGVEDLKMLKDPKEIYGGDGDQVYTVARKGLEEDAPAAYKVLKQYNEDYDMINKLMPKVWEDERDAGDVAEEFLDEHPDLVEKWTAGVDLKGK